MQGFSSHIAFCPYGERSTSNSTREWHQQFLLREIVGRFLEFIQKSKAWGEIASYGNDWSGKEVPSSMEYYIRPRRSIHLEGST